MPSLGIHAGLTLSFPSPAPGGTDVEDAITEEAGIRTPLGQILRVVPLVHEDEMVPQGAPVACLRDTPGLRFVAPMPGRVARITLLPGRKLSEIVLFRESGGDVLSHNTLGTETEADLRRLMQEAGIWPWLRRRPFGGMPAISERPDAIFVMATDTRPLAPDPRQAVAGRESGLARGLDALALLTDGPILVCQQPGAPLFERGLGQGRVRAVDCGPRHPQGLAGYQIHQLAPAAIEAPVWDIHAEDVAALGELLDTGIAPMTRYVRIGGAALRKSRLVRTQLGADLRELTRRHAKPGAHVLWSGSPIDGHEARWLAPRHRQVTAMSRQEPAARRHWLVSALTRSAGPKPVIPTAALSQSFGGAVPAAPFVRALSSGDDETAIKMGVLSLLAEDVALAEYVLGGDARMTQLLDGMLDRIRTEFAA